MDTSQSEAAEDTDRLLQGSKCKAATKSASLLLYKDIPLWQRDNEFLLSGYRESTYSMKKSLASIFTLHNETVSIHTHMAGAILFYLFQWQTWLDSWKSKHNATSEDVIVFSVYFIGVANCFVLSASCHVIWNHSPSYASMGNRLDYLGIILLMWGASIPSIYYGFYCNPILQRAYWTLVSGTAVGCAICTCFPQFKSPTFRKWRAALHALLGLNGVIFAIHGVLLYGWQAQNDRMALDWMMLMAMLNFIGAATYAARIPERFYPGRFDVFGASHQIFHIMVILAGLAHFMGLLRALAFTRSSLGVCSNIDQ